MSKLLQMVGESFGLEKSPNFHLSRESEKNLNEAIRRESITYMQKNERKTQDSNDSLHRLNIYVTPASTIESSIEASSCPDRRQSHCGVIENTQFDAQRKSSL
ncbi:unnamed protein product, partial [Mesorhabditis belari]|uniref:Uncharacterized protein n=1 Tax=Mesorhabditis belari TaxID=2138241 RepID=A0AAF3F2B1_9BILA